MESRFIKEQQELIKKIDLTDRVVLEDINTVAGTDLAYWQENGKEYAV